METRPSAWRHREIEARASRPSPDAAASQSEAAEREALRTFVGAGCVFDGRLVVQNSIRIDGEFRGAVVSTETVIVGEAAAVEARIQARTVMIRGAVVGEVEASRELVLHRGGRLTGALETPSLVIERGAILNGSTRMFRPEEAARARAERAATSRAPAARGPAAQPAARIPAGGYSSPEA